MKSLTMKSHTLSMSLAAAGLVLGAILAAPSAHAGTDVYFSVGVPAPVYVQPRPVFVQPQTVYVQPQPVYSTQYGQYGQYYGVEYGRDHWRNYGHHRRHVNPYGPYGDLDRDGVPNRYDRDRDGDGIGNRYDRFPDQPRRR